MTFSCSNHAGLVNLIPKIKKLEDEAKNFSMGKASSVILARANTESGLGNGVLAQNLVRLANLKSEAEVEPVNALQKTETCHTPRSLTLYRDTFLKRANEASANGEQYIANNWMSGANLLDQRLAQAKPR